MDHTPGSTNLFRYPFPKYSARAVQEVCQNVKLCIFTTGYLIAIELSLSKDRSMSEHTVYVGSQSFRFTFIFRNLNKSPINGADDSRGKPEFRRCLIVS